MRDILNKTELKQKLLLDCAKKEPKRFFQIDVWRQDGPDYVFTPDKDGLVMSQGVVHELKRGELPLRVHIHESADLNNVLKGLDRARKCIQDYMDDPERMFKDYEPTEIPF